MKTKRQFLIDEVLTYPWNLKIYSYVCHKIMRLKANKKRNQTCIFPQISYKHFVMFTKIIKARNPEISIYFILQSPNY